MHKYINLGDLQQAGTTRSEYILPGTLLLQVIASIPEPRKSETEKAAREKKKKI
jgi:hypothetical protein